jgi:hypothetical protein
MSKVVNCNSSSYDVYIGRPSKWGNPFTHKDNTLAKFKCINREEAISKHKIWLLHGEGKHLLKELSELEGKVLGCHCKPLACHGDTLVKEINKKLLREKL